MSYIARRLGSGVLLILALTLVTYVVFFTIPVNPTCLALDCSPGNRTTPAQFAAAKHELGLDRPVLVQYGRFLWGVVRHGSFGESFTLRYPIGSALAKAIPPTASIVLGGAVMLVLLALPLGLISALRPNHAIDRAVLAASLVGIAMHPFVVGLLLQRVLADEWRIVPHSGYCPLHAGGDSASGTGCGGVFAWASHLYLPWLVFALFFLPLYARMFRARLLDTLGATYVRTARAKGASELRVLGRHVLRNAILPILPMLAMDVGTAVTTAIYVEMIFDIGGLGTFAVGALSGSGSGYDLPAIVGVVFIVACAVVVLNLLADLAIVVLDPRIGGRTGSRRGWRTAEGALDRRRVVIAAVAAAAAAAGVTAAAILPSSRAPAPSLAGYIAGARVLDERWSDRLRLGQSSRGLIARIEKIVVGPDGWAVTAALENRTGLDLSVTPGFGTNPDQAGFSLQFVAKDRLGSSTFTALRALAYEPPLPATLPAGAVWRGSFGGPGRLPAGSTRIYVGFGLFSTADGSSPATIVTATSFRLG